MQPGTILCVVGAPRTGKSYLVKKLSEHYGAEAFYEWEGEAYPERLQEDIARNTRPVERALWFRNRLVGQYTQALRLRAEGTFVVADATYLALEAYVDITTDDVFERELLHTLMEVDRALLSPPDVILHLVSSEEKTRAFIDQGGRAFDRGPTYYRDLIAPVEVAMRASLAPYAASGILVEVDRSTLDFAVPEDLQTVIDLIDARRG